MHALPNRILETACLRVTSFVHDEQSLLVKVSAYVSQWWHIPDLNTYVCLMPEGKDTFYICISGDLSKVVYDYGIYEGFIA